MTDSDETTASDGLADETMAGSEPTAQKTTRARSLAEQVAVIEERLDATNTMTGPLTLSGGVEVPATGQSIEQDWSALVRFEGDRIAELHEFYDQLTLMMQLGLVSL